MLPIWHAVCIPRVPRAPAFVDLWNPGLTLIAGGDCRLSTTGVPNWKNRMNTIGAVLCPSWCGFSIPSVPGAIVFVASWSLTLMAAGSWGWALVDLFGKMGRQWCWCSGVIPMWCFSSPNVLGAAASVALGCLTLTLMTAQGWGWGPQHHGCPRWQRMSNASAQLCTSWQALPTTRVLGALGFVALWTLILITAVAELPSSKGGPFSRFVPYDR